MSSTGSVKVPMPITPGHEMEVLRRFHPDVTRTGTINACPGRTAYPGRYHACSIRAATVAAQSGEHSRASSQSARSIPAVTPPLVTRSPSSTTRSRTTVRAGCREL